ncbi:MAG: ATP synthase F1 subunit delta [Candidatus Omnitrophica bacterium]|nr:ATP synthase F1 subunit delta [Candidatus Omnitrophota bacterium]
MNSIDPVASRYAHALFDAANAEGRADQALEQLTRIEQLMRGSPPLRELMGNPDVDPDDKAGILERVLGDPSGFVRAFIHVVVARGRAESLPDIAETFQNLVDEQQGRLRVTVRSAHPLSEDVLTRLRATLAMREGKTIELTSEVDPALLGGLHIRLDHHVIDGTVQRQLHELRERLMTVRVY